jgi:hypothetical protein
VTRNFCWWHGIQKSALTVLLIKQFAVSDEEFLLVAWYSKVGIDSLVDQTVPHLVPVDRRTPSPTTVWCTISFTRMD